MLTLRPQKLGTYLAHHPWVLSKSLTAPAELPTDGEVVEVAGPNGRFLARGIYNGRSHVRVRLYSWRQDEPLDDAFWARRLELALQLRRDLGYDDPAGAARLVFSEADGLSGLIVDRYGEWPIKSFFFIDTSVFWYISTGAFMGCRGFLGNRCWR